MAHFSVKNQMYHLVHFLVQVKDLIPTGIEISKVPILFFALFSLSASLIAEENINNLAKSVLEDFNINEFEDSKLIASEIDVEVINHRLALGSIRKKQSILKPEIEIKVSGRISHLTFEIDRQYDPLEIYQYFFEQLEKLPFEILYQCHASECGSNNHWANRIFKQRLLNGLERTQHYSVARLGNDEAGPVRYLVFYLVQRGNKRIYVHFDLLESLNKEEDPLLDSQYYYEQLKTVKRVRIRDLSITAHFVIDEDKSKSAIQSLLHLLQNHSDLNLVFVGHVNASDTIENNLENSRLLAKSLKTSLQQEKMKTSLPAYGVGSLAPLMGDVIDSSAWVELVNVP